MPPQSRSQRRRSSQRPALRPVRVEAPEQEPEAIVLDEQPDELRSPAPAGRAGAASARPPRAARRTSRPPEPVDYTQDYAAARRDLTRIVIISSLLLVVMIGLSVSGVL